MPIVLLFLEHFLIDMVYATYVIMNYLFILYGLLAESIDALHSLLLMLFSPCFAMLDRKDILDPD